jgi:hypothetical protein
VDRDHVESSSLQSVGYDAENETLEIEFRNGRVYQFYEVPGHVYEDLMAAGSHGKYFAQNIKNRFRYSRL